MPTLEELFANDPEFLRLFGRTPQRQVGTLGKAKQWCQGAAAGLAPLVAMPAKAFAPEAYAEAERILQEELQPTTAGGEWAATPSAGDVLYGAVPEEYRKGAITGPLASIGRMAGNIFTDPLTYTPAILTKAAKAPALVKTAIAAADLGQIGAAGLGYGSDIGAGLLEGAGQVKSGLAAAWHGQLGAGAAQVAGGAFQAGVSGALGAGLFVGGMGSAKRLKEMGRPPAPRVFREISDIEDVT